MTPSSPLHRRYRATVTLVFACGCASPEATPGDIDDVAEQFMAIERVEVNAEAEVAELTARSSALSRQAAQVVDLWRAQEQRFATARATYVTATATARIASADFATAAADFRRAEQQYRRAALVVVLAAASSGLCATAASTRTFRARLRASGVDLGGQDIDHIWPRSLGGVDHPLNYQVLDSNLNRSLGAGVLEKFMTQPLALVQGLAVSALSSLSC